MVKIVFSRQTSKNVIEKGTFVVFCGFSCVERRNVWPREEATCIMVYYVYFVGPSVWHF